MVNNMEKNFKAEINFIAVLDFVNVINIDLVQYKQAWQKEECGIVFLTG